MKETTNAIAHTLADALGSSPDDIVLEHPADLAHGDLASNAALTHASARGTDPHTLAEELADVLQRAQIPGVAHVTIAGPGFVNVHFTREAFAAQTAQVRMSGATWGANTKRANERTMVEYTDPNPFKEFHIGHLMNNTIGESLSRIVAHSGAAVRRANYQGDVGMHVAMSIWGMQQLGIEPDDVSALGTAYAKGATAYKEDATAKAEIEALNKKIYERSDPAVNALYDAGRETSLAHFEDVYERLGTTFDHYFFESETGSVGMDMVRTNLDTVFEESDGAIIYRGEKHGLHTRVFINAQGLPTYEAKELGLAKAKYDTYPYERSIVVTGNEITEYFKVLREALREIHPDLAAATEHVPHGMLRLTTGKMSSRTGDVITGESLLNDMRDRVYAHMHEPDTAIADQIAVAAIRYAVLKQGTGRDIVFDPEQSLSFEGDSGPYLQYAHTRANAVLKKAADAGISPSTDNVPETMTELERLLYRFPEVVERALDEYEPHHITTFLTQVAGAFNSWYAREQIVADDVYAPYRVALTDAFRQTMANGLWLLGIETPERM